MKKALMMGVALTMMSMPAFAKEDSAMHTDEMAKMKTEMAMKKMDTNGDGMISKAEHDSFGNKMFTDADSNKDGSLSSDEVMAAKKKEIDEMKAMKPEMGNK